MDVNGRLNIPSLLNYMLNTSILHESQMRKRGDLQKENVAWMLNQWNIHTNVMPKPLENIFIRTEAKEFTKLYAKRDFFVYNCKNEHIASADTYWLLINIDERKLKMLNQDLCNIWGVKLSGNNVKPLKLKSLDSYESEFNIKVGNLNIDSLNHVYNVCYIEWALNYLPFDIVNNYKLENMVVSYLKETYLNDELTIMTKCVKESDGFKYYHKFIKDDNNVICLIESTWAKQN